MDFGVFGRFEKEARVCFNALTQAAPMTITFHNNLQDDQCFRKSDGSPVTIFDHVTQAIVMHHILAEFPDEPIIAEESLDGEVRPEVLEQFNHFAPEGVNVQELLSKGRYYVSSKVTRYWTIDPIDGTAGFKRPNGQWAVAIAVIENSDCVFSAMAWPNAPPAFTGRKVTETLYCFAARGIGSFITNGQTPFDRVRVPATVPSCQFVPPRMAKEEQILMAKILSSIGVESNELKFNSMTKAVSIALGVGDLYIRFTIGIEEPVYDIAPISTFVEEAGGIVTTGTGKPVRFTNRGYVNASTGIIITNRGEEWHRKIVREFQKGLETFQ